VRKYSSKGLKREFGRIRKEIKTLGRKLMRVPLDFDYPLNKVWYGYFINYANTCIFTDKNGNKYCEQCRNFAKIKGLKIMDCGCPDMDGYFGEVDKKIKELCEPPKGDGYQLWETTSEGSPVSPVFKTLDELCEWCERYATTFARFKATKEQWKQMLSDDFVFHKEDNIIFM
jgi:hypothetical protein